MAVKRLRMPNICRKKKSVNHLAFPVFIRMVVVYGLGTFVLMDTFCAKNRH